jgi:hypothetical protein
MYQQKPRKAWRNYLRNTCADVVGGLFAKVLGLASAANPERDWKMQILRRILPLYYIARETVEIVVLSGKDECLKVG